MSSEEHPKMAARREELALSKLASALLTAWLEKATPADRVAFLGRALHEFLAENPEVEPAADELLFGVTMKAFGYDETGEPIEAIP